MPVLLSRGRLVWTSTLVTGASLALVLYLLSSQWFLIQRYCVQTPSFSRASSRVIASFLVS